mgnify:CR=1 FL=1
MEKSNVKSFPKKNEGKKEGSKTTESKHGKTRLSYLDVDKDWFRPANRGDIKKKKNKSWNCFAMFIVKVGICHTNVKF